MSLTITDIDYGSVLLKSGPATDETFTAGGASTTPAGTILGRLTATGALVPYVSGAADGSEVPVSILVKDVEASGAGDLPIRVPLAGEFAFERLIIAADGDNSNVTPAVRDQLRTMGLLVIDTDQLGHYDNPNNP